jgi:hypothetical protein
MLGAAIMNREILQESIHRGLGFLSASQAPTGELPSFAAFAPEMTGTRALDSATFPTALILDSLAFVLDSSEHPVSHKARRFLKREMIPPGLWRYWTDDGLWHQLKDNRERIDPDLDCTCCASFVLRKQPDICLRNVEIVLQNRNEKGLFRTWIRDSERSNDVDSVVNANVLLYVGERPETRAVVDYLNEIVLNNQEAGSYHYYLDDLALYYMMSRAFFHGVRGLGTCQSRIRAKVTQRLEDRRSREDALLVALAFCTLLNYSYDRNQIPDHSLAALAQAQQSDGGWPIRAFYAGPEAPLPHAVWFGSRALTTGFCLEALARYVR